MPIRRSEDGGLRVALVTSRDTRRWVIPKGWPWPDRDDHQAAAEEAREEAGLLGEIGATSIGTYTYGKRQKSRVVPIQVTVFVLVVTTELDDWPEQDERRRVWFTITEAADAVHEAELADLIRGLAAA